jgi:hypothetical protein
MESAARRRRRFDFRLKRRRVTIRLAREAIVVVGGAIIAAALDQIRAQIFQIYHIYWICRIRCQSA